MKAIVLTCDRYHPITNVNQVIRQCPLLKQNLPNVKLSNESHKQSSLKQVRR